MDGMASALARVHELQQRLTTLRPQPVGRTAFAAQLDAARASAAAGAAGASAVDAPAPSATGPGRTPSAAWNRTALAATSPSGVAAAQASGRLTKDGAPVELAAFGNGRIPADRLREIGRGGHRLWAPAADAFRALEAAAARDGVRIGVTDSYRSYAAQVDVAERKGLYSQGGLAAKPGTSDHGWGRSLDLDLDGKALAWMRAHGREHGFVEDTPRESWHWTYTPKT